MYDIEEQGFDSVTVLMYQGNRINLVLLETNMVPSELSGDVCSGRFKLAKEGVCCLQSAVVGARMHLCLTGRAAIAAVLGSESAHTLCILSVAF
jgi:hypothetical protein